MVASNSWGFASSLVHFGACLFFFWGYLCFLPKVYYFMSCVQSFATNMHSLGNNVQLHVLSEFCILLDGFL